MKAFIQSTSMERNMRDGPNMTTVNMTVKVPNEEVYKTRFFHEIDHGRVTITSGHEEDMPRILNKQEFDIKEGDEVVYRYIRKDGNGPETSMWMRVKSVKGDMLTCYLDTRHSQKYEFRVLASQVLKHRKPDEPLRIRDRAITSDKLASVDLADVSGIESPSNTVRYDPNFALRKSVLEFELV